MFLKKRLECQRRISANPVGKNFTPLRSTLLWPSGGWYRPCNSRLRLNDGGNVFKKIILAALCIPMTSALALSVKPNSPSISKISQSQKVLESKVGFKLDSRQRADLEELAKYDNENLVEVSAGQKKKAIYCVAGELSAGTKMLRGGCVHIWSTEGYDVVLLGVGATLQAIGSVFRLEVTYDDSRYDKSFDPVPGNYGVATFGGALGVGFTTFLGDSGNKSLSGGGVNVGLGIDFTSLSLIHLEK